MKLISLPTFSFIRLIIIWPLGGTHKIMKFHFHNISNVVKMAENCEFHSLDPNIQALFKEGANQKKHKLQRQGRT